MSTRDLIDAIEVGDSVAVQSAFENAISQRIADRLDTMRQDVAQSMFKAESAAEVSEEVELTEEELAEAVKEGKVHPDAIHISDAGSGKYKVHAVGSNMKDHINVGEHLSDTELDDFQEMGGRIKHVKDQK